jgi:hypothetical protein
MWRNQAARCGAFAPPRLARRQQADDVLSGMAITGFEVEVLRGTGPETILQSSEEA